MNKNLQPQEFTAEERELIEIAAQADSSPCLYCNMAGHEVNECKEAKRFWKKNGRLEYYRAVAANAVARASGKVDLLNQAFIQE